MSAAVRRTVVFAVETCVEAETEESLHHAVCAMGHVLSCAEWNNVHGMVASANPLSTPAVITTSEMPDRPIWLPEMRFKLPP